MRNPTNATCPLAPTTLPTLPGGTYRTTGLANGPMAHNVAAARAMAAAMAPGMAMPHPTTLAYVAWQLNSATTVARR